jgi:ribosomal protein S6
MLLRWKELEFDHFPTEEEAIEIAKKSHPYFVWLFENDKDGLDQFKRLYEFNEDVWKDMSS